MHSIHTYTTHTCIHMYTYFVEIVIHILSCFVGLLFIEIIMTQSFLEGQMCDIYVRLTLMTRIFLMIS